MTKFEYKIISLNAKAEEAGLLGAIPSSPFYEVIEKAEKQLNELGQKGWELVTSNSFANSRVFIFKRPIA